VKTDWGSKELTDFNHGSKTLAAVLLIILLSVVDAYLTLILVSRGAEELNPVMAYYLDQGPFAFFLVKYFLTCVSVMLILSMREAKLFGLRIHRKFLLCLFIITLAIVVNWELMMLDGTID
jgi:hypothetical protein